MKFLFEKYLLLYSFYLSTNKRTANGSYKSYAKNLSFSNCYIVIFGAISTFCLSLIFLTGIDANPEILNTMLLTIAVITSIAAIKFRTRFSTEILELDKNPKKLSLDTLSLNLIQIGSMAIPIISTMLLYRIILE